MVVIQKHETLVCIMKMYTIFEVSHTKNLTETHQSKEHQINSLYFYSDRSTNVISESEYKHYKWREGSEYM